MKKHIIISAVIVIVVGAGSFYGGMKYDQSKTASARSQRVGQFTGQGAAANLAGRFGGAGAGRNAANGSAFASGQIVQVGANSITVQMSDGSSKVILFSGSTQINKEATGSATDLATGKTITIQGDSNSDGSITAKTIQVR